MFKVKRNSEWSFSKCEATQDPVFQYQEICKGTAEITIIQEGVTEIDFKSFDVIACWVCHYSGSILLTDWGPLNSSGFTETANILMLE